jgi:NADH:ubiquinone oxidoreductase subunit E
MTFTLPDDIAAANTDLIATIDALVATHGTTRSALIPILAGIRRERFEISDVAMQTVADRLGLSAVEVEGVVTFYHYLGTKPTGRNVIHVCRTLSCEMGGAATLIRSLELNSGAAVGSTSEDGMFTLEYANCVGLCGTAPAMLVNRVAFGSVTPEQAAETIARLRAGEAAAQIAQVIGASVT